MVVLHMKQTTHQLKEATMATFSVTCPCGSGHVVTASDAGFSATTITVDGCSVCRQSGIVSREMRKSWGLANEVSSSVLVPNDGLVAFV